MASIRIIGMSLALSASLATPTLADGPADGRASDPVPEPLAQGRWGTTADCRDGRVVTFSPGWMLGDPAPPRDGGPVQYLPLKLKVDQFETLEGGYRLHAASGETVTLLVAPGGDLLLKPEKVRQGSICSAIAADAHLYQCPPADW